jgi:hypothetical protein
MAMNKVTGLWVSKTANGVTYLSGKIDAEALKAFTGTGRLMIWLNDKKEPGSKSPDYRVTFAPDEEQKAAPARDNLGLVSTRAVWDKGDGDGTDGMPF